MFSHSVVSDSLWPYGLWRTRLLCPWDSPGKDTGVCHHFLLQGILPTQGLNQGLPHCRRSIYHLSHQGSHKCGNKNHLYFLIPMWSSSLYTTARKKMKRTGSPCLPLVAYTVKPCLFPIDLQHLPNNFHLPLIFLLSWYLMPWPLGLW